MKVPGSFKALAEQVHAAGYQLHGEIRLDSDGNVIGVPVRPLPPDVSASKEPKKGGVSPRRSPLDLMGTRPPEGK